jgi:hypothetical protein
MFARRALLGCAVALLVALPLSAQSPFTWRKQLHGNGFGMYVQQNTIRKADDVVAVGWLMGSLSASTPRAEVGLRSMLSLDPITLGECGYPRLLSGNGHFCADRPFQDLSHSHSFFMELIARARVALGDAAVFVEGGPVGTPALGPISYMHRPSAAHDPLAPMSHHETNPVHVANGVVTGGAQLRGWTVEASAFNARPGDEDAYDLDVGSLSSWAARAGYTASGWTAQGSVGELRDVGSEHAGHGDGGDVRIYSASLMRAWMRGNAMFDAAAAWSRHSGGELPVDAFLLEASAETGKHTIFARAERVHRVEVDVQIEIGPTGEHNHRFTSYRRRVSELAAGYTFRVLQRRGIDLSAGARAGLSFIPEDYFTVYYGTPRGRSLALFVNVQPTRAHVH